MSYTEIVKGKELTPDPVHKPNKLKNALPETEYSLAKCNKCKFDPDTILLLGEERK